MSTDESRCIAIFPWGDCIEDFLDPIGKEASSYVSEAEGGWLFGYILALQNHGWNPIVIWGSREQRSQQRCVNKQTGATVWLIPVGREKTSSSPAVTSLRRWAAMPRANIEDILLREKCRAILVQEYEEPRFDILVRLGRRLKIPVYATFQGGDQTASWIEAVVRRVSLKGSSGLIVSSSRERERIIKKYNPPSAKIHNIPNPVDVRAWQPQPRAAAREKLGISQTSFVVFNHGRIDVRRKGLDVLVQAWSQVWSGSEGRLTILGTGQDNAHLADLLETHGCDGIDWINHYVSDAEMIRTWLSAADLYVSASRTEGMPVALLEAMACGLPVVASDAQGTADILAHGEDSGGLLVPRGDASALATAIIKVRDDALLRARLSKAARRRTEEHYSLQRVGKMLTRLFDARHDKAQSAA